MLITYSAANKRWEASWTRDEHYTAHPVVKAAGFAFDYPNKIWHTAGYHQPKPLLEQAGIAAKLPEYLDDTARAELAKYNVQASTLKQDLSSKEEALALSRATDSDANVPKPEGLEYLPYQRAGVAYAMRRDGVLIADEMGLGKTIQGIGISNADASVRKVLVISPATPKINWSREWRKWDTKGLSVGIATSKQFPKTDVVIINFDIVKKHKDALNAMAWDLLIVDECHKVKNPKAARTQLILGKKTWVKETSTWRTDIEPIQARRRVFLTGTPILNRPVELWTLVKALDPNGLGKSRNRYETRYCAAHHDECGHWINTGASNLPELQERLRSSFMVRRLKSEVLKDLPPKRRQVLLVEPDARGRALIAKEKVAYENFCANEGDSVAMSEMSRLRKEVAIYKAPFVIEHVQDMLEDGGVDKVIVFAHHHEVVDKLMVAFGEAAVKVDGRMTKMEQRQAAVDRFQNDPTCKVFVGSIQAAGVAITLTAASHVVFAELDWVPGNVSQAEDRAHRIGQTDSVNVLHIILEESLDARMINTIIGKQAVIDAALDTRPAPKPVQEMPKVGLESKPTNAVEIKTKAGVKSVTLTPEQVQAIHTGLKMLRGVCNGARDWDGAGFSKTDVQFGWSLADAPRLSAKQAAYGQRLIRKYRGQLGEELVRAAGIQ